MKQPDVKGEGLNDPIVVQGRDKGLTDMRKKLKMRCCLFFQVVDINGDGLVDIVAPGKIDCIYL